MEELIIIIIIIIIIFIIIIVVVVVVAFVNCVMVKNNYEGKSQMFLLDFYNKQAKRRASLFVFFPMFNDAKIGSCSLNLKRPPIALPVRQWIILAFFSPLFSFLGICLLFI